MSSQPFDSGPDPVPAFCVMLFPFIFAGVALSIAFGCLSSHLAEQVEIWFASSSIYEA